MRGADCGMGEQDGYPLPSTEQWITDSAVIAKYLREFLILNGLSADSCVTVRQGDIADIALRVDKRRSYYRYFHSIEISERKTSALIAYWVIKFHPFILDPSPEGAGQDLTFRSFINEHFAAYLLVAPCLDNRDKNHEVFGDAERALRHHSILGLLSKARLFPALQKYPYRFVCLASGEHCAGSLYAEI